MGEKTILDYDNADNISKADILYLIQGIGADRDRQATLGSIFPALFDYVIDSDAKFQALCDGSVTGANSVYIAEGSWTANANSGWDLSVTNTLIVQGHINSTLNFSLTSGSVTGITGANNTADYLLQEFNNVHLNVAVGTGVTGTIGGFNNCFNMTDCSVILTSASTTMNGSGFYGCLKLDKCEVTANSDMTLIAFETYVGMGATAVSDENKYSITNCKVHINLTGTNGTTAFQNSNKLSNCHVEIENAGGTGQYYLFLGCNFIDNTTINGGSNGFTTTNEVICFTNCDYINNVKIYGDFFGTAVASNPITGFATCNNISNFNVTLQSSNSSCFGFSGCNHISNGYVSVRGGSFHLNCFTGCTHISSCHCYLTVTAGSTNDNRAIYDSDHISNCFMAVENQGITGGSITGMYLCNYITNAHVNQEDQVIDGYDTCSRMSVCSGTLTGVMNNECSYFDTATCF